MTDTIDRDELLRELTKRRAEKEHDRNLGSGFYRQGYLGGFDDAIKIVDSIQPADVLLLAKIANGISRIYCSISIGVRDSLAA